MARLGRKFKILVLSLALLLLIIAVLWYPYKAGVVPEWKIQVFASDGRSFAGAQVGEQWNDPIDEGITSVDSRNTDSNGFIVFPQRLLRNRLALGSPPFKPAALITVCTANQYGDAVWDEKDRGAVTQLQLKDGACPYD